MEFLCTGADCSVSLELARIFVCTFLAIVFLQSGVDKIVDRGGNIEWLTGHFASSPLAGFVPLMVTIVTATELVAGALTAIAVPVLLLSGGEAIAIAGISVSAVGLLMLLFGQRMAKDYAGAAVLVPYFVVAILGLVLFA